MDYPGSLHNHTQMSNLRIRDCIIKEEDLINKAIELGHSVVAITDHETIAAAVRVEKIKNKVKDKIKVIMGNEIYLCRDGLNNENFEPIDKYYHFILLAKDREGFKQLCELSTRAWMRSYMGRGLRRVPTYYQDLIEIIGQNPGHVIGSTACLGGFLPTKLLEYENSQSKVLWLKIAQWCNSMQNIFGKGNFYLELQPSASKEQSYVNRQLINLSNELGIGYIITCDSHYLQKEDREIHKAFLNAQDGDREVDAFYATTYLMDTNELTSHLENLSQEELQIAFANIKDIQNKCEDYSILKSLKIPSLKWNDYSDIKVTQDWIDKIPYFDTFLKSDYIGDKELVKAIIYGISTHPDLQNEESYKEINNNLETTWISSEVNKAHWSAYYLNLQKIIDLCWEANSIVGPGRGSGVGFLLLYCLGITQINPLREETKCFAWRFLNPERVSVLDIDFDIEGGRRGQVLNNFRKFYGEDKVANVLTLRTEKSKSAILTAARGLGYDNDIANYLAALIPADRGQLRSLSEVFYGNDDKDFKPIPAFVNEMTNNYPDLWKVAQKIEGLICGTGIHAGGVIFVDEPFTNSTALMRAPDGTIITQFDLHDCEDVSLIKYDALSVEAMDKIHACLDLLVEDNYIVKRNTLKETYEQVLGIYNLERNNIDMWKMVWDHKILSLFQMEQQSGIQGIAIAKPKSVNDLSVLNSVIRLMAPDKDSKTPLEMWRDYRKNINLWIKEMKDYGLSQEEIDWLSHHSAITDGICESQEGLMSLVQEPRLGGNSLTFADKCRKGIAKKQGKLFQECEDIFYENIKKNNCSEKLAHYVWDVLLRVQRGYSFNRSHCLSYSLVALQEMNLAFKYPIVYWNCACLLTDSGSYNEDENSGADYGKIAKAINTIRSHGINISLVGINDSVLGFKPDAKTNTIYYGLKALSNINNDAIEKIIAGRPYASIKDFVKRCPLTKTATINLIKAGAFDSFWDRRKTMAWFLWEICDKKKRLTLQNMPGLIKYNLLPQDSKDKIMAKRIYEFNRYLKAVCATKDKTKYKLDERAINFLTEIEADFLIKEDLTMSAIEWDKTIYQNWMNVFREWIAADKDIILQNLNEKIFLEEWEHYAAGTISTWEMQSMCFYYHEHELANVDREKYGIVDFSKMENEKIEYFFKRGGRQIPIYELNRIMGTVIAKNDTKHSITLLTPDDVVNVQFTGELYAMYKKQISQIQPDGSKKVIEKSWFTRGTLLMIQGFKRDDTFVAKSYSKSLFHQIYKIDRINSDNTIELRHERAQGVAEDEAV